MKTKIWSHSKISVTPANCTHSAQRIRQGREGLMRSTANPDAEHAEPKKKHAKLALKNLQKKVNRDMTLEHCTLQLKKRKLMTNQVHWNLSCDFSFSTVEHLYLTTNLTNNEFLLSETSMRVQKQYFFKMQILKQKWINCDSVNWST